jgi:hypothetical protein
VHSLHARGDLVALRRSIMRKPLLLSAIGVALALVVFVAKAQNPPPAR